MLIRKSNNSLKGTPCSVDGCTGLITHKSFCYKHYRQMYRHGYTFATSHDKRPAIIEGNIAKIPLGLNAKDGYVIVDKDFSYLDKYNWYLSSNGYASTSMGRNSKTRRIHQLIIDCPIGMEVDHKNNNKLNNLWSNLRVCSHAENMRNVKLPSDNTSGYKGVCWDKHKNKWMVRLGRKFIGYFNDIDEAAKVYNKRAIDTYGEFAHINKLGGI